MVGLAAWGAFASVQWYRWREEAWRRRSILEDATGLPAPGYRRKLDELDATEDRLRGLRGAPVCSSCTGGAEGMLGRVIGASG